MEFFFFFLQNSSDGLFYWLFCQLVSSVKINLHSLQIFHLTQYYTIGNTFYK